MSAVAGRGGPGPRPGAGTATAIDAGIDVDVLVVGGGPVGACCAALLAREGGFAPGRIALLERQRPAAPRAGEPVDLRVSALSRASARILAAAGAWEAIAAGRPGAYERMHVWHASEPYSEQAGLTFDAAELAEPDLGCIVENRAVQHALLAAFAAAGGRIVEDTLQGLRFDADCVQVTTGHGALRARLVVGADGARSRVRELAGLEADSRSYGQGALVCVVRTGRPHRHTAWQRFLGHGTLAFLPLADGSCSIVWSVPSAEAERLRVAAPAAFEAELAAALDHALGPVQLAGERAVLPLARLAAPHYVIERCALIGDAAHVVHPLAGQGVNLGLLDAAALAQELAAGAARGEDPGALRELRRYERWRRGENELMSLAFDGFNRLLATGSGPLARIARRALVLVGGSALARRVLIERALGLAGELPEAARPPLSRQAAGRPGPRR